MSNTSRWSDNRRGRTDSRARTPLASAEICHEQGGAGPVLPLQDVGRPQRPVVEVRIVRTWSPQIDNARRQPLRGRVVHPLRHLLVVTLTNRGIGREERIELRHIGRRKDDLDRRGVAVEVRAAFRPWNGNDALALSENPGQGKLRRSGRLCSPRRPQAVRLALRFLSKLSPWKRGNRFRKSSSSEGIDADDTARRGIRARAG